MNAKNLLLFIVCLIAIAAGIWAGMQSQSRSDAPDVSGFVFPQPRKLENINLTDQHNAPLSEAHFENRWTFVYVGYTFCPDACPIALTVINQTFELLKQRELSDNVSALLVSVDPRRDTPERLREYVKFFNEEFNAATGDDASLKHFASQVSAIYSLPDDLSDPNYLVDHSSSIVLINPDAAVHAIFTPPQESAVLADDFGKIKSASKWN